MQESRLATLREVMVALINATETMRSTQSTIAERTSSAQLIQQQLEATASTLRGMRAAFEEQTEDLGKRVSDLARAVRSGVSQ